MARFNTVSRTLSINTSTVFSYAFTGGLITLGGSAGYTVTLVDPKFCPGQVQNFYNSTSGNITISAPSGGSVITGPGLSSAQSQTIPTTAVFSVTSDGTNYILTNDHGGPLLATTATVSNTLAVTTSTTSPVVQGSTTTSGTLTVRSTSSATKAAAGILMDDGIASTSTTTGTLVVTGGVGVSGTIYGALNSTNVTLSTTGTINGISVGATSASTGAFTTLSANSTVGLSGSNAQITISPTGTGSVTVAPAVAGNINNMNIGASTRGTGAFTTLAANSTVTLSPANAQVAISPTGSGSVAMQPAVAGAIDNMSIGSTTRGSGAFTTVAANSTVTMTAGSTSTSSGTGTLQVTGGVGVTGSIYVDGMINYNYAENVQSGSYTLALTDAGKVVTFNVGGASTVTIPSNASVPFPIGTVVIIFKNTAGGGGSLTLAAAGGVTISKSGIFANNEEIYCRKRGTDTWSVAAATTVLSPTVSGGSLATSGSYSIRTFSSSQTLTVS
jgi:cytoskeletal protein CcmA (bactofilin family)